MKHAKVMPRYFRCACAVWLLFIIIPLSSTHGAYLRNIPVTLVQPSGEVLEVFASGDEFYNWLHDENSFTIVREPQTGAYVYAIKEGGDLLSSGHGVNEIDPYNLNIEPHLHKSIETQRKPSERFPKGSPANTSQISAAPKAGTLNNICIFIRFKEEPEFTEAINSYETMFNNNAAGANSMFNYFEEVSYGQLDVHTTFYPTTQATVVSYEDSQPRAYYQPYDAVTNPIGYSGNTERRDREHTLLKNAVDAVSSEVPAGLNLDGDGDGRVDNVCFIIYGAPTGWSSLLWPHMWSLYSQQAYINGKRVYTYNFQLQTSLASSGVGVLCHEMFHSLGAPDLYHYSGDGLQPVYQWDIMEWNLNPPQHMSAFMKFRYGNWISAIPEITTSGTYSLSPVTSATNNCYKIASPNSTTEYFVVEYRMLTGTFENSLPGEGLLVYRVNTALDGEGNADGPPDELYVYRPGGTTTLNGNPALANFSLETGRTDINDSTNPSGFLSSGANGGLNISDIGSAGSTISFTVDLSLAPDCYVQDPGFEMGSPNPHWSESSINFGTPLCTVDLCGSGTGTGPHSGSWWSWFGGTTASESGSLEQSVKIPAGDAATLKFYLEIPAANTPGFLRVSIDGNQLFEATDAHAVQYTDYSQISLDVSGYADGEFHLIRFESTTDAGAVTNFFVDDICLVAATPNGAKKAMPWIPLLLLY